jgi:copper chaperone
MEKVELKVEGMTCGGCVKSIQNALNGRNGVDNAVADLEAGTVAIEFDGKVIQKSALEQAIVDAGFDVAA